MVIDCMGAQISTQALTKNKTYEQFQGETLAWVQVTEHNEEKQAIEEELSLPV